MLHAGSLNKVNMLGQQYNILSRVAQSVASLTVDPGVASLIPARSNTFGEMDHEIISTVILLLPLIQGRMLSCTSESMYTKYWLSA